MGFRTFLAVQEFIWYNCSAVSGSSSRWLYGGTNGDFLQEGLCHMLCDPGLLHPEPLSLQQATADPRLHRRHLNTQRQVWVSLCGVSAFWCIHKCLWQIRHLNLNVILSFLPSCWGFSFALERGVSILVGSNILLSMLVQQQDAILEFSQEKMHTCPSSWPSSSSSSVQVDLFINGRNKNGLFRIVLCTFIQ